MLENKHTIQSFLSKSEGLMRRKMGVVFIICIVFSGVILLTENMSHALKITTAVLTTRIERRKPEIQTVTNRFPPTVNKLYFFTWVKGADEPTTTVHEWYWKGNLVAKVPLKIESSSYRTWSSKNIMTTQTGQWSVLAKREDGSIAKKLAFFVDPVIRTVHLYIVTIPGDADVYVNGRRLGNTGKNGFTKRVFWDIGDYVLKLLKAGYKAYRKDVHVSDEPTVVSGEFELVRE